MKSNITVNHASAVTLKKQMAPIRLSGLLAGLALCLPLLAQAQTPAAASAMQCGKTGGTLTYEYDPEPVSLSTVQTTGVPVSIIAGKIYESLLNYDGAKMTPAPGLAESWTVSDDKKTYTFKLRHGVLWQDGKPFTSADVKFSIEKVLRPYHTRGKVYFGEVDKIDTPDATTVVFHLKTPVPYFLQAFQGGEGTMFPEHAFTAEDVASRENLLRSPIMSKPVGTGPFMLKTWSKGSYIELVRNPHYWHAGFPCLDKVILRVLPDASARAVALENGEVDVAPMNSVPEAELARLSKKPDLVVTEKGTEGLGTNMWLDLNNRDKYLSNKLVRQAISASLNRQQIINVIWYGHGVPSRGPLVSTNPFFDKSLPAYPYDLKKANALLDEAGFPKNAQGVRFKITQNFLPYGDKYIRLAEYVRQQLKKVGIEVDTQSLDLGGWLKSVFTTWDYQMTSTFTDNRTDPTIGSERLFTTAYIRKGATFTNSMGYSNPKVDAIFAEAATSTDPAKRTALFDQMQQILHDDMPVIYLVELPNVTIYNKRVHNLITNGISFYSNWESVWKD